MCRSCAAPRAAPCATPHVPSSPRSEATLAYLAESCDEFLVHGVDVEGMQASGAEEGQGCWVAGAAATRIGWCVATRSWAWGGEMRAGVYQRGQLVSGGRGINA